MIAEKLENLLDEIDTIEFREPTTKEELDRLSKNMIYLIMIAEDIQYEIRTRP